jgi:DNA repair exonuclease SbcCD ATPase subunit
MSYRILELRISNFKRLTALELAPDGESVILTGDNAQGKSSVLDAILMALTNTGLTNPIHTGADRAQINLKLTDGQTVVYDIERSITGAGSYLRIKTPDGKQVPTPQRFLDSLIGNLAFDPAAFATLKPKEQAETLRAALSLNFADLDAQRKAAFESRTDAKRVLDSVSKRFDALAVPPADTPNELASVQALLSARQKLSDERAEVGKAQQALGRSTIFLAETRRKIAELERQLKELSHLEGATAASITADEAALAAMPQPKDDDFAAIDRTLADVERINDAVRLKAQRTALRLDQANLTKEVSAYTATIQSVDEEKERQLAAAPFPVKGMAFGADGAVTFNGLPFTSMSAAEQLRISTLVAMAQNPGLHVILIREGALINKANTKVILDAAKAGGYQCWIEKFQEDASSEGIHIFDGSIVAVNGKEVSLPKAED